MLSTYVKDDLKGDLSQYATVGDRINIVQYAHEESRSQNTLKLENTATGMIDPYQTEAAVGYAIFAVMTSALLIVVRWKQKTK